MRLSLKPLLALATLTLLACGGTEAPTTEDALVQDEHALVTCSATCANGGPLSCTGNSCSALNNSHVVCDGQYTYCPPPPTTSNCALLGNFCENLNGSSCSPVNSSRDCCIDGTPDGNCICRPNGRWLCTL
ncbi:hypothetical protein LZ198_40800 [Myxococcus sp. K15C18031901]|uniref:hypothetical protein n=1 Tax=Myxococcus dinghuensis TaxID=2906761 RepID=UPI0020A780D4|nr:hypothetical protein [Myxococcus dinghuensis]MCP3105228.1 hypothetical protein [Myxococcus dinghuensis]